MPKQYDPEALIALAADARRRAYCPYSGYAVGAAVATGSGRVFSGCNIENAAYSDTVCAERVALFKAVSEGCSDILAVAVVAAGPAPPRPCGSCLQVMAEIAPDAEVLLGTPDGVFEQTDLRTLLPKPFGAGSPANPAPPRLGAGPERR